MKPIFDRTDFDTAEASRWPPRSNLDGIVEILCIDQEEST
jgi:hypothetical protein